MISEVDQFPGIFSKKKQNNQIYDTLRTLIFRIIQNRNYSKNWGEKFKAMTLNFVTLIISSVKETPSGRWV